MVNRESLNRQNQQTTLKPVPTSSRFKVASSIVITMNLEFNSMCPRKKHSLFQLTRIWTSCKRNVSMTIGMSMRTKACQIRGKVSRSSLYWKKNLPRDISGPGGGLTKVQTTTRPDHVWPEVSTKIGKAAQNREKQERKNEKPKLDNARRLRGIYFVDPDDQDY